MNFQSNPFIHRLPPTWSSFRFTHLVLLIPSTLFLLPLFSLLPILLYLLHQPHPKCSSFVLVIIPTFVGLVGFLASLAIKKLIFDSPRIKNFDPVRLEINPSNSNRSINLSSWFIQALLSELIRVVLLIGLKENFTISSNPIAPNLSSPSSSWESQNASITYFLVAYCFGIGWSTGEMVVVGILEWVQEVLLYKPLLIKHDRGEFLQTSDYSAPQVEQGDQIGDLSIGHSAYLLNHSLYNQCPSATSSAVIESSSIDYPTDPLLPYSSIDDTVDPIERQSCELKPGATIWEIPWFIIWSWRLNSILIIISLSLLTSHTVFSISFQSEIPPIPNNDRSTVAGLVISILMKLLIVSIWRVEKKSFERLIRLSYLTLLIGLMMFCLGLAFWGLLN
ncbi:hypothetical protein O181_038377 [Austropuccinia psidii MF-1]|uniref:Uncharacterized protein n=1 Tax=Austropuccinia psidii MF-1 TaxID=1389203 RepID=A0A9Q3DEM5_9BASI|nr:hypothetical protein [Austropuccinia psidii MF-1]